MKHTKPMHGKKEDWMEINQKFNSDGALFPALPCFSFFSPQLNNNKKKFLEPDTAPDLRINSLAFVTETPIPASPWTD